MRIDGLKRLLDFLDVLRVRGIMFRMDQQLPDECMVSGALVSARVEVTFGVEGMHFCAFRGSEAVETDVAILNALFEELCSVGCHVGMWKRFLSRPGGGDGNAMRGMTMQDGLTRLLDLAKVLTERGIAYRIEQQAPESLC